MQIRLDDFKSASGQVNDSASKIVRMKFWRGTGAVMGRLRWQPPLPDASLPGRRVAVQVAHTEHDDGARLDPIEHSVRKPVDDCPTRLAMLHLLLEGIVSDATQRRVHLADELSARAPATRTGVRQSA